MTFKRVLIYFIVAFIMQLSVINLFSIRSFGADLVFCLMVVITFLYDDGYRSIPIAMLFGIIIDICASTIVGFTPMVYLLTGIIAAACRIWLNPEKIVTMIATSTVLTIVYETMYWGMMRLAGNPMGFIHVLKAEPIYIIYNLIVSLLLFLLMHKGAEKYHNDRYTV